MDFKLLNTTRSGTNQNRQAAANSLCQQGYLELAKAKASGFKDKNLIKSASRNFIAAIRQNRTAPDPRIGLGYLMLLLGNYAAAERHFSAALKLDPNHPEAQILLDYVSEKQTQSKKTVSLFDIDATAANVNYDELIDKLEQLIQAEVHQLMSYPPPQPSLNKNAYEQLQKETLAIQSKHQHIARQLELLDDEFDMTFLRQRLKPFETVLKRFDAALQIFQLFEQSQQQIQEAAQAAKTVLVALPHTVDAVALQPLEKPQLEQLLDRCDHIADCLDAIQAKGYHIGELEQEYEKLIALVERCQDALDEQHDRLKDNSPVAAILDSLRFPSA